MSSGYPSGPLYPAARPRPRRADRRAGLTGLMAALAADLERPSIPSDLRARFEDAVRGMLGTDRVRIRDGSGQPDAESGAILSFPLAVPRPTAARLEVTRTDGHEYDEWDLQQLNTVSILAALVLALERAHGREWPRGPGSNGRGSGSTMLLGSSMAIRAVRERVERVAATEFTVLIEGESGTGKELVARRIHELSRRNRGPFVAINCAALVETLLEAELFGIEERTATGVRGRRGKFEAANHGTLFLDEVSDLSMSAQGKLLRAIQEMSVERVGSLESRRVNARIIVATNRSLAELVERERFRLDLYYRLCSLDVRVPPLRARREDIPELASVFLERHRHVRPLTFASAAIEALVAYDWPGNVRELQRAVERAVALARNDQIGLDDLPPAVVGDFQDALLTSMKRDESLRTWARRYARLILERHGNNRRKACEALGISYHTLRAYLRDPPSVSASQPVEERSRRPGER